MVCSQLTNYIELNLLFKDTITGFRKGHSTQTALLHIRDLCRQAMKCSEISILAMIDFSKAFDTLSHQRLLMKLQDLNCDSNVLHWFQNYLHDRKQFIHLNNLSSGILPVVAGVPQGSILGPILFNIYSLSLTDNIQHSSVQYADDTQIHLHARPKDLSTISKECSTSLNSVHHWAKENDLALNPHKTVFLTISTLRLANSADVNNIQIDVNGTAIKHINECKNLGVIFDQNLNFMKHHISVLRSSYGILSILKRLKKFIPENFKKELVTSLVYSKVHYCNMVTYPLNNSILLKYTRLDKACAAFITGRYSSTNDAKKIFGWKNHNHYTELSILCQAYKCLYFTCSPKYLDIQINPNSVYGLRRNSRTLLQPGIEGTFKSHAASLFNKLPVNISSIAGPQNFNKFRNALVKRMHSETESDL